MFSKLKQFKQAKELHSKLSGERTEGSGGWGKVKMTMNGAMEVISVSVDPELLTPVSKEKLEAAIKEAGTNAVRSALQIMAKKAQEMGGIAPQQ
ncbi:MAG: YbaB/EbfC family nucleoid-associated protein [Patescibacteria group bacterium]